MESMGRHELLRAPCPWDFLPIASAGGSANLLGGATAERLKMKTVLIGVIGGSGLGQMLGDLGQGESLTVGTPFGRPSGPIVRSEVQGVPVAVLSRHGAGRLLNPSVAGLIGMPALPGARLAREAEICCALVALPTDYDCWKPHPTALGKAALLQEIIGNLQSAPRHALDLIRRALPKVAEHGQEACTCQSALELAI